jgi:hypothetical protein
MNNEDSDWVFYWGRGRELDLSDHQANIDCQRKVYELHGPADALTEMNPYRVWVREIST